MKEARNQSQNFNRKSILRNTTHCQSHHLQAMLTGLKRRTYGARGFNEVFSDKAKIIVSRYAMINIQEFNFTLLIGCASLAKR